VMLARRTLLLFAVFAPGMCLAQANNNPSKTFAVTGKVKKPGQYELREGMRIVDALKTAGDFLDSAQIGRITIIRGRERLRFNYARFVAGSQTEENILVESGDVIMVP